MNTVFVSKNLRKSKIKIFSKKKKKNSKKRLTRKVVCVKICRLSVEAVMKLEKRIDKQARKNTQVNFLDFCQRLRKVNCKGKRDRLNSRV